MVLFSQFQNGVNKMILFHPSMDGFRTTNKWLIIISILVLKTLHNTSTFIQCNMIVLMKHKSTGIL